VDNSKVGRMEIVDNLWITLRTVDLSRHHNLVVKSIAFKLGSIGATDIVDEYQMPKRRVDLTFKLGDIRAGIEVDWKLIKWKSIEKLRGLGLPLSIYILRHENANIEGSIKRLHSFLPPPQGKEVIISPGRIVEV